MDLFEIILIALLSIAGIALIIATIATFEADSIMREIDKKFFNSLREEMMKEEE